MKRFLINFFTGFKKGVRDFGENIAVLVNTAVLLVVYLIGVGLTSLLARFFGKKFLDLKPEAGKESYWESADYNSTEQRDYLRQF